MEIAVISGKGGTGKSSIAAAFATLNEEVVVADCDVDAANLHLVLQPVDYLRKKFFNGELDHYITKPVSPLLRLT